MRKLLFFLFVVFSYSPLFAQTGGMMAQIDHNQSLVVTIDGKSSSTFVLKGDQDGFSYAKEEAAKYVNYMTSEWKEISSSEMKCTLTFTHEVPVDYIRKMMTAFGVDRFVVSGKEYSIDKLCDVVKE